MNALNICDLNQHNNESYLEVKEFYDTLKSINKYEIIPYKKFIISLDNYCKTIVPHKYESCDINAFKTHKYKEQYLQIINNTDLEENDKMMLFEKLLYAERIYKEALVDTIMYCKHDKNRKTAIYKQLAEKFFISKEEQ